VSARLGRKEPDFDPLALATHVAKANGLELEQVHFFTGVPRLEYNPRWHHYWSAKLANMGRDGVVTHSIPLKYDGPPDASNRPTAREKGIDVAIALTMARLAREERDIMLFSEDSDFSGAIRECYAIAKERGGFVEVISVYPEGKTERDGGRGRGLMAATRRHSFDKSTYEMCLDPRNYTEMWYALNAERNRLARENATRARPEIDFERLTDTDRLLIDGPSLAEGMAPQTLVKEALAMEWSL